MVLPYLSSRLRDFLWWKTLSLYRSSFAGSWRTHLIYYHPHQLRLPPSVVRSLVWVPLSVTPVNSQDRILYSPSVNHEQYLVTSIPPASLPFTPTPRPLAPHLSSAKATSGGSHQPRVCFHINQRRGKLQLYQLSISGLQLLHVLSNRPIAKHKCGTGSSSQNMLVESFLLFNITFTFQFVRVCMCVCFHLWWICTHVCVCAHACL